MFLSEQFIIEKIDPIKLVKYGTISSGVGAVANGAKGFFSGLKDELEEDHFIKEWKEKLRTSTTEIQRLEAIKKLEYWTELRNKKRLEHAKLKMKTYAKIGAVSAGVIGAGISIK